HCCAPSCLCPSPRPSHWFRQPKPLRSSDGSTSSSRRRHRRPRRRRRSKRVSRFSPKVSGSAEREVEAGKGGVPIEVRLDLLHQGIDLVRLRSEQVEQAADPELIARSRNGRRL